MQAARVKLEDGIYVHITEYERLRQERDAWERSRETNREAALRFRERAESAEAEVGRLTEGLREARELTASLLLSLRADARGEVWVEDRVDEINRALLSANPPQGDAAEGSTDGNGKEPSQ